MDLAKIKWAYRVDGWGAAAYTAAMMVALLLYAYCLGERSSRRIERLCGEAGLVKVGVVALDGTKVDANAALAANRTAETIAKGDRAERKESETTVNLGGVRCQMSKQLDLPLEAGGNASQGQRSGEALPARGARTR